MDSLLGGAAVGAMLTGVIGLLLGIVAFFSGDMTGGGLCLIAAALAFGLSLRSVLSR